MTALTRVIVAGERWLPVACGASWWLAMYPGLFGEDSLIALAEVRSGRTTVWFTAWWIHIIDVLSLGTRAIPLLTLAGVLLLAWSVRVWATAVLPPSAARARAVVLMCATPLIGALGIQLRHDAWMAAGLLLAAAVLARVTVDGARIEARDAAQLGAATLLIATRHNGVATILIAAAASPWVFPRARWRVAGILAALAVGITAVTWTATRAAGHTRSVDPAQAVEWLMGDISCVLSVHADAVSGQQWAALERVAARADWPQPRACRFVNPLQAAPSYRPENVEANLRPLVATWFSLAGRYPLQMLAAHFGRLSLFLPPFATGWPDYDNTPFIHSTILPNTFGLEWACPHAAAAARTVARAWNAGRVVLANAAIWLAVLAVAAWRRSDLRAPLMPALVIGAALEAGLLVTAPVAEGRYALFILACGQLTALYLWLARRSQPA